MIKTFIAALAGATVGVLGAMFALAVVQDVCRDKEISEGVEDVIAES